ncbi:MAG: hypothetical protein ACRC6E_08325 [Fusobacteriaceae bacterium]
MNKTMVTKIILQIVLKGLNLLIKRTDNKLTQISAEKIKEELI